MTATPPPKPLAMRPALWISIVAALALGAGAVSAGYFVANASPASSAESAAGGGESPARPAPQTTGTSTPVESGSPETSTNSVVPASCDGVYSRDWAPEMGGLVLNPEWVLEAPVAETTTSFDVELNETSQQTRTIVCRWGHENGGSDRGVTTGIGPVTAEEQQSVLARMQQLEFDCYEELGGTRCVTEMSDDNGSLGESHFLRDGVWIATKWLNISPDGYTHDIINTLWS